MGKVWSTYVFGSAKTDSIFCFLWTGCVLAIMWLLEINWLTVSQEVSSLYGKSFSWNISPMFYLLAGFFPNEVPYNGWCFFILNLVRFCLVSSVQAKKYLLPCLSRMVFNMEFFQNHLFYYLRTFTMGWFMYIVYILLFKFKYLMF